MNVDRAASLAGVVAVLVAGGVAVAAGRAADPPAVFTAAQADAGRREVQTNTFGKCTDCHGVALAGRTGAPGELPSVSSLPMDYQQLIAGNGGRVPSLVGATFVARWTRRSTKDLTREFEERFGVLSEATRLNLTAYFLRESGARPGAEPLTTATDVTIGAIVPLPAAMQVAPQFEIADVRVSAASSYAVANPAMQAIAAAGGTQPGATDPGGGLTLFDALDRQLGLKLEKRDVPVPVIVLDHIEAKPTDN